MGTEKHVLVKKKMFANWLNSIQDEGRPLIVSTPEMVDSATLLTLAERKVTTGEISEQQAIPVSTAHKIVVW